MQAVVLGGPGSGKSVLTQRLARLLADTAGAAVTAVPVLEPQRPIAVLPTLEVRVHWGRRARRVCLYDTPGLGASVVPDPDSRALQAQALDLLLTADAVLHVVDAAAVGGGGEAAVAELDRELAAWGKGCPRYLLLASKMDGPWSLTGLTLLQRLWPDLPMVPVSAVTGRGLKEVRAFLARRAQPHRP